MKNAWKSIKNIISTPHGKVTLIILIIILVSVTVYSFTREKTSAEQFIQVEKNNLSLIEQRVQNNWQDILQIAELTSSEPYKTNTDIGPSIEIENQRPMRGNFQMMQEVIEWGTINISSTVIPGETQFHSDISFSIPPLLNLEGNLHYTEDFVSARLPDEFYHEMLWFEPEQFGNLMEVIFPGYHGPEELIFPGLPKAEDFWNTLENHIGNEQVSITSPPTDTNNDSEAVKKITLDMEKEEANLLFQDLQKLLADTGGWEKLAKALPEAIETMSRLYGMDETHRQIFREIANIALGKDSINIPGGIHMTALVDGKNRVIDRNISLQVQNGETSEKTAEIDFNSSTNTPPNDREKTTGALEINHAQIDNPMVLEYTWQNTSESENEQTNEEIEIIAGIRSDEDLEQHINFTTQREQITDLENDENIHSKTNFTLEFPKRENTRTKASVIMDTWEGNGQNLNEHDLVAEALIEFEFSAPALGIDLLAMELDTETNFEIVDHPDIVEPELEEGKDLSELSEEDWESILKDIRENIIDFIQRYSGFM